VSETRFVIMCDCKRSIIVLSVEIKYSVRDLICDVISQCASSFNIPKINLYDKIIMKNLKKRKRWK